MDDDFLEAVEADNTSTPAEPPKAPELEVKEPEKAPEPVAEPPQPAAEELVLTPEQIVEPKAPVMVPIGVLHEVRDELKTVKADLSRFQQAQQPEPVKRPDDWEDPEGARAYDREQFGQALQNVTLNTSERFARKEYGAETVETAKAWALDRFSSDPLYRQQILNDPDPYERVVTDWRREQVFSEVKDPKEFEQFKAWKAAQNALSQPGGQPPPPTQASPIPPPSLASAPSAGDIQTEPIQSEQEIFDEVVGKR